MSRYLGCLTLLAVLAGSAVAQELNGGGLRGGMPRDPADLATIQMGGTDGFNADPSEGAPLVGRVEEGEDLQFWAAFSHSFAMICVTEAGDKTFFIAAILAMRHPRSVIFMGALGALAVMTVLSAAMGFALPSLLPRKYTHLASACLFLYFGLKLLWDVRTAHMGVSDELEEVEEELNAKKSGDAPMNALEEGEGLHAARLRWKVASEAFVLTFMAEWGDRSQIATIAMAASRDALGVVSGGVIGHALCTGLAVVGGKMLATRISEKLVNLIGGILFLIFGLHAIVVGPEA